MYNGSGVSIAARQAPRADRAAGGRRRRSLTLVEVLASLAIMGSVLTTVLVAHARSLEQLRACELGLTAQDLARELHEGWLVAGEDVTVPATGTVDQAGQWHWERSAARLDGPEPLPATEITLLVTRCEPRSGAANWTRAYHWWVRNERK
ncbi:MAG: prepilin-type N-terminal cleavage/methylation domain-containing protein [Planctomycetes bacterium]|nr:prepilin-type N-terminal cleavage/methylation domain-containing protein [Planctomycetota bacterium]